MKNTCVQIFFVTMIVGASGLTNVSLRNYQDPKRKLTLDVAGTQWDFFEGRESGRPSDLNLQFVARGQGASSKDGQSTLTMRIDSGQWPSARNYGEKWLKEYPKFGFELQMSKETQHGHLHGFEMELTSSSTNRRIRQFVVNAKDEVWIFTCSSSSDQFDLTWSSCEKILNTASLK